MISNNYIDANRKIYHFFNFSGGCFVCIVCIFSQVWQAAFVEGVWALVALFFLARIMFFEYILNKTP
jgi:hypothetical protein